MELSGAAQGGGGESVGYPRSHAVRAPYRGEECARASPSRWSRRGCRGGSWLPVLHGEAGVGVYPSRPAHLVASKMEDTSLDILFI